MNAKSMLDTGKENNYKTVKDCYEHIFLHEELFFLSENKDAEIDVFENDIDKYELELSDTLEEAYIKIEKKNVNSDDWNEIEDSQNKNLLGC